MINFDLFKSAESIFLLFYRFLSEETSHNCNQIYSNIPIITNVISTTDRAELTIQFA